MIDGRSNEDGNDGLKKKIKNCRIILMPHFRLSDKNDWSFLISINF